MNTTELSKSRSTQVNKLLDGSYFDKMVDFYRYGVRQNNVSEEDRKVFDRIDRAKQLWLEHKNDNVPVKILSVEFDVGIRQAQNYLADAKAIYALVNTFDFGTEMLIHKMYIDKGFEIATAEGNIDGKLFAEMMKSHREWAVMMREHQERMKPERELNITWLFSNDHKLLGWTDEGFAAANAEVDKIEAKVKSGKWKNLDITEAEVEHGTT